MATVTTMQGFISRMQALVLWDVLLGINGKCPESIREIAKHVGVGEDVVEEYISQGSATQLGFAFLGWVDLSGCDPVVFQLLERLRNYPQRLTDEDIGNTIKKFREEVCFGQAEPPALPTNQQNSREKPTIKKDSLKRRRPKKRLQDTLPQGIPLGRKVAELIDQLQKPQMGIVETPGMGKNCNGHVFEDWQWLIQSSSSILREKPPVWEVGICKRGCSTIAERLKR